MSTSVHEWPPLFELVIATDAVNRTITGRPEGENSVGELLKQLPLGDLHRYGGRVQATVNAFSNAVCPGGSMRLSPAPPSGTVTQCGSGVRVQAFRRAFLEASG